MEASAPELRQAASAARVASLDALAFAAEENVQIHGGIGFTWESDCQFYYRRNRALVAALGSRNFWADRLVRSRSNSGMRWRRSRPLAVIPAKAGTHLQRHEMGPRFRGDDEAKSGRTSMAFNDTPTDAAYRAQARDWLAANYRAVPRSARDPAHPRRDGRRIARLAEDQARGGLYRDHVAEGDGRAGPDPDALDHLQPGTVEVSRPDRAVRDRPRHVHSDGLHPRLARADRPLRRRPALAGDEVWCQLFSEPAAGSDLAGIRTKAVRDGDDWIIDGQKVWTTNAHLSDFGIIVTRTDPSRPPSTRG